MNSHMQAFPARRAGKHTRGGPTARRGRRARMETHGVWARWEGGYSRDGRMARPPRSHTAPRARTRPPYSTGKSRMRLRAGCGLMYAL